MPQSLGKALLKHLPQATLRKTAAIGLANARDNLPHIQHTIAELDPSRTGQNADTVIVMASGPSLHRKDPAKLLHEYHYGGPLVVADSALAYCLRNELVPDFVVTVDSHPTRIVRWFGDKSLEQTGEDEYFLRQELDPTMHQDGLSWNRRLIQLVDRHGPSIKAIISTSASAAVRERCQESGMALYWWNPMYDDYESPDSWSRRVYELTKVPCMVTGGNVGTSAYVFAAAVLKAKRVALVGMDLGYLPGSPLTNTQYYTELLELFGDRVQEAYIQVYNPHLRETWYTDPTYYWYRQSFVQLAAQAPCVTYNCTEGGILFGKGIKCMKLEKFLQEAQ